MPASNRHILYQGPVLGALARSAWMAFQQKRRGVTGGVQPPGPLFRQSIRPRPRRLVQDYVRHVGGDPASYRDILPSHLFPQWTFPLQARTIEGLSYPIQKVLNGGCRIQMNAPLPIDVPLDLSCRLEDIDDNGRRAVLHQRAVTGTADHPEALVSHMYAIVPLHRKSRDSTQSAATKERPRVPAEARELTFLHIDASEALDFAKLTGDFNPVHWVPAYARRMGFRNVILHGFSTLARAIEALNLYHFGGDIHRLSMVDVRFTRPLVLPAEVGVYVHGDDELYVGDAPGGPAYLTGSFASRDRSAS